MSHITSTSVGVILPSLQTDLAVDGAGSIWVVNAYALFLSSLILVGGALGDRLGLKHVLLTGVILFTLAAVGCGLAKSSGMLILARAVQGVGGALMVPTSLAVLSANVLPEARGRAFGLWSTFTSLTVALGPVIGGYMANAGHWRWMFLMNVPLALIVLIASTRIPPDTVEEKSKGVDWAGAVLIIVGIGSLTLAFTEGPGRGWNDLLVLGLLLIGVGALIGFVYKQSHSDHPLVPPNLFNSRVFSAGNLLTFFLYMAISAIFFFLPLNLIQTQGYPESIAGLALLPYITLVTVISPWSGAFVDRIGSRMPLTVGPLLAGAGMLALGLPGLTNGPSDYWVTYFPGVVLLGLGMGFTVAPLTAAIMKSAPDSLAGAASGINNAIASSAGVLAVAILGGAALTLFGGILAANVVRLPVSESARQELTAEAAQLGGATVPASFTGDAAEAAQSMLRQGFAATFRIIMFICAGLSWASALIWYMLCRGQLEGFQWTYRRRSS